MENRLSALSAVKIGAVPPSTLPTSMARVAPSRMIRQQAWRSRPGIPRDLARSHPVPAGSKLRVDAAFDNSAENPLNPDPSIRVTFGEKTTDEMMVGFVHYSYVDKDKQADMPTRSFPEKMRQQIEAIQKMREQQRKAKAEAEAAESGDR